LVGNIGLNLIYLVPGETGGMEVVARELIEALLDVAPGLRFTAFVNREAAAAGDGPWGEALPAVTVPVNARRREQWVFGEQVLLPRLGARAGVELMHSLASTAPAWGSFRRVVTVHDLIYARFPEAHSGLRGRGMRMLVPLGVRHSQRVIADSQSTREDLIQLLGIAPERIDVAPLGLGAMCRVQPLSEAQTRARFELGERRVLLSLSAKRPHKNLRALIGALARIPAERRPLLVLPGYATWHEDELREHARSLGLERDVRFEGWVDAAELEGLWALADAFVFPSLYEGFGLPLLEAMARGVPVACANASSLPEVAGDAALLFDPNAEDEIAAAIECLLGDPALVERLRAKGLERVRRFTWERTARLTLDSYARALGLSGTPLSWTGVPATPLPALGSPVGAAPPRA
jgi:glycosyltransferase involved in cell wall biosynthesis